MNKQKITVFIHVAILGRYQEVFDEVMHTVITSKLAKVVDEIIINVVGVGPLIISQPDKRIRVIRYPVGIDAYEHPTLEAMRAFGRENTSAYVLYLNCLGGRHVGHGWSIRQEWRKLLYYLYIERFEHCFNALKNHDVVGVDWSFEPFPHMTSNNYWATGKHLAALPSIYDCAQSVIEKDLSEYGKAWQAIELKKRHAGEFWIGMRDGVKAFSLFPLKQLGLPTGEFNNVPWWGLPNIRWESVVRARLENKKTLHISIIFLFQILHFRMRFILKKLKKLSQN